MASGNAFAEGLAFSGASGGGTLIMGGDTVTSSSVAKNKSTKTSPKDYSTEEAEKALERIQKWYDRIISNYENQKTHIQNEIERLEEEGVGVSADYYEAQIDLNDNMITQYEKYRQELLNELENTPHKTDEWYELSEAFWNTEQRIQELTVDSIKLRKAMVLLYKDAFDGFGDHASLFEEYKDNQITSLELYKEQLELNGELPNKGLYDEMIARTEEKITADSALLDSQNQIIADLKAKMDTYDVGSAEYYEAADALAQMGVEAQNTKNRMAENKNTAIELKEAYKDLYVTAWDAVRKGYENYDTYYENQKNLSQSYIDRLDTLGINVPDEAYEHLIDIQKSQNDNTWENYLSARKEMIQLEASGVGPDDQRWIDKYNEVNELYQKYIDGENEVFAKQQEIIQNQWDKWDQVIDRINYSVKTLQNISDLVSNEDVATEDGEWTAEGLVQLGTAHQQMEYNKQIAAEYAEEIESLNDQYDRGEITEKVYTERLQELEDGQWDAISAYEDAKEAIVDLEEARIDMVEEGIDKEIEAYQELIKLKQEELESERD